MPTVLLVDYLEQDRMLWDLLGPDKPALLAGLAQRAADAIPGLQAADLVQRLQAREAEGSTAVGNGLALPHAMLPEIERTVLVVGRVAGGGVDYGAPDHLSVDLVFLLLSPERDQAQHLRVLARLARIVGQQSLLERLRDATGPAEALRILIEEDARHVY